MELEALPEALEELPYPIDSDAVLAQVGSIEIDAPDDEDSITIATTIDDVGHDEYDSADQLFTTIIGNLGDQYIGRKFYDDRGGELAEAGTESKDDVSF
ncbi:Uncharacterized protein HSRCO_0391 [Halanaeroarchaeum sp. HSR-CO]|uniref:DUF5789 family protein n=1 Tax=Halanaeroarchaeum sp. HSR-CO TaxID=2866382 RepID=UPI00217EB56C|nr:hypothetical protein [Halanaeroarchaeum sp. HSR-CO]UWG46688.1 Uncharacterized protein HSRCO_0391 [Halanaeroarchaeum sp. HSR-CO]